MIIKKLSRLLVVSDDIFFTIFLTSPFLLYILHILPLNFTDKSYILAEFSVYSVFVQKGKSFGFFGFMGISYLFRLLRQLYFHKQKAYPLRTV